MSHKSCMNRRFKKFTVDLDGSSIEDFFGIINEPNEKLKFALKLDENNNYSNILFTDFCQSVNLIFTVTYRKNRLYNFLNFPIEISKIISSFLDNYVKLDIKIAYLPGYPFKNPHWSLLNLEYNVNNKIDLLEYYRHKINRHNHQNKEGWSAVIYIEKDLLEFIQKINNFNQIIK